MHRRFVAAMRRGMVALAAAALLAGIAVPASADPPPWAPAWGYRAKHRHGHHDYAALPLDLRLGRCNREIVGVLIGGAAGGLIGAELGERGHRAVPIIAGTIIGAVIGGSIGRAMDEADYACFGQALEQASDGQAVRWRDPNGVDYQVTPQATRLDAGGRYCREYRTTAVIGGRTERVYGTACRQPDGSWELVG